MEKKKKFNLEANSLILIIMIILCIIVYSSLNKNYFTPENFVNVLLASTSVGLCSIGITFLMMIGGTDLSAGAVAASAGVFVAWGMKNTQMAWGWLVLIAICGAACAGLINGLLVTELKLVPFIATLVASNIWKGVAYLICDGRPISIANKSFQAATAKLKFLGLTIPIYLMFLLFIIFSYVLKKTKFGRSVFAIGGNREAARLAGISSKRVEITCYIMVSIFSALAGIVLAGRMNSGNPASNTGLHFDAITAANLAGVSMVGGIGDIPSVVLGVLLVQSFNSGLNMVGVSQYWQYIAKGLLLLGSLSLDFYRQKAREKKLIEDSMKTLSQKN